MGPTSELGTLNTSDLNTATFVLARGARLVGIYPVHPGRFEFRLSHVPPGAEADYLNDATVGARTFFSVQRELRAALGTAARRPQ